MKALKILITVLLSSIAISSCHVDVNNYEEPFITLEEVVTEYDLWYVDYNRTTGTGDVPFLSTAFTISFINGKVFANNNLVGIETTGNGYGVQIGFYDTREGILEIDHDLDGYVALEVNTLANGVISLYDNFNRVTYYLEGYQKHEFDYDLIFYDNIEYFLQEYDAWEKTYVSEEGALNDFDNENFLRFTPENTTTFYSSEDEFGTDVDNIYWDYEGDYFVADVQGYDDLKILTLDYDFWDNEDFELTVINDQVISLYHVSSGTTYEFTGRGFIQYLKEESSKSGSDVRKTSRKRTKVQRQVKIRKY